MVFLTQSRVKAIASLTMFIAAGGVDVLAQSITLPPTLDPSKIDKNLKTQPEPKAVLSKQHKLSEQVTPQEAAKISFVFKTLVLEGNTALSTEELTQLWSHKVGDEVRVGEIFSLANAVTNAYANAGYATSFGIVPEQDIQNGIVKIVVIEGRVSKIKFNAMPSDYAGEAVRDQLVRISGSTPLATKILERNLLLMDDLPGWDAKAILSPDEKAVGGSVLTLEFTPQPSAYEISWNNFLPSSLGSGVVGLSYAGLRVFDDGDDLSASFSATPGINAYRSFALGYSALVGTDGQRLTLNISQSDSRPQDATLLPLEYKGLSRSVRLAFSYPLVRSRASTVSLETFIGAQGSDTSALIGTTTHDHLRSVGTSVIFDFASADQSSNLIKLNIEQGLDVDGAKGNSRTNGSKNFTISSIDYTRTAPLVAIGTGALSYCFSLQSQVSLGRPLFSAQESSYGGRQFGRFFDSGSVSGENAVYGSLELRYALPVSAGFSEPIFAQLYTFFDAGYTRQQGDLIAGEARSRHAATAGLGVRFGLPYHSNALIEVSRPVTLPSGYTGDTSNRISGSFGIRF
jgi:hemolysin activation/secretion protein